MAATRCAPSPAEGADLTEPTSAAEALRRAVTDGALELAEAQREPDSLAAATTVRAHFSPEVAAAALSQASLRRRARQKFGADAAQLLFTADGLEQATRPAVAAHRAQRLVQAGVRRVVDLGCGIGADSRAFLAAGLEVVAVELDPVTAVVAEFNAPGAEVMCADAVEVADAVLDDPATVAFCDPARRSGRGRTWDVTQFTPPWSFVEFLLARRSVLKLGPGVPLDLIPDGVEAAFVSHAGDLVEAAIWAGDLVHTPGRVAEIVTAVGDVHRLVAHDRTRRSADRLPRPGDVIWEPDPAVLRAGATDTLAAEVGAVRLTERIGYLLTEQSVRTPFARGYEVLDVLRWNPKDLKAWLREQRVGVLEIKKRGLEFNPAHLRRNLLGKKGYGSASATFLVTPTSDGARTLVVRAVPQS